MRIFLFTFAASLLFWSSTFALTMRCGNHLIEEGDPQVKVLEECGEPSMRNRFAQEGTLQAGVVPGIQYSVMEQWTYNFGSTDFIYYLTFQNGRLVHIETGDYGY